MSERILHAPDLGSFLRASVVPVPEGVELFGAVAVDRVYSMDGNYWVIWLCEPPGWEVSYRVTRDEWNADSTERRIHEWEG